MCWEFHGRDRAPLEDVGGTHGEDGGSREDHSPLGVCSRRLYGGASNYTYQNVRTGMAKRSTQSNYLF
jgi:hypothetical protein